VSSFVCPLPYLPTYLKVEVCIDTFHLSLQLSSKLSSTFHKTIEDTPHFSSLNQFPISIRPITLPIFGLLEEVPINMSHIIVVGFEFEMLQLQ
jgi:hypothetical protein